MEVSSDTAEAIAVAGIVVDFARGVAAVAELERRCMGIEVDLAPVVEPDWCF